MKHTLASLALAGSLATLAIPAAPALADGAALTRNIIGGAALAQRDSGASAGRYDDDASLDDATMTVHVRVDHDGELAAYRIDVPQSVSKN